MLRPKITQLINSILEESEYFNYNDFQIEIGKPGYSTTVKIVYEYDNQYFIDFRVPSQKSSFTQQETTSNLLGASTTKSKEYRNYKIEGKMRPGELSYEEDFSNEGIDGISKALNEWLDNLWEDLTLSPQNRAFLSHKEEIEKIKQQVNGIPDEYFTVEEANEIKDRLKNIEDQLAEKLNAENPDKEESQNQIDKLHNEIEILKETIFSLNKAGWFKSFLTKTFTWLTDPNNQKLLKAGKDIVINMLPEGQNP